jgi:hypothetical protein
VSSTADGLLYGEIDGVDIKCGHLEGGKNRWGGELTETVKTPSTSTRDKGEKKLYELQL